MSLSPRECLASLTSSQVADSYCHLLACLGKRLSAFLVQPQYQAGPTFLDIGARTYSVTMPSSPGQMSFKFTSGLAGSCGGESFLFLPHEREGFLCPLSLASKGLHLRPEGLQLRLPPHPQCLLFIRSLFLSGWFV